MTTRIRTPWLAALLAACCLLLLAPGWALAAEVRTNQTTLIAPGETIDDDLFASGDTVPIGGHVTGDAYTAARTVTLGSTDFDAGGANETLFSGTVTANKPIVLQGGNNYQTRFTGPISRGNHLRITH